VLTTRQEPLVRGSSLEERSCMNFLSSCPFPGGALALVQLELNSLTAVSDWKSTKGGRMDSETYNRVGSREKRKSKLTVVQADPLSRLRGEELFGLSVSKNINEAKGKDLLDSESSTIDTSVWKSCSPVSSYS
jgi:hypothetical protein